MKLYLKSMLWLFLAVGIWGCSDDGASSTDDNRPLTDGELCKVRFTIDNVGGYQAVKTRSSQEGGDSLIYSESLGEVTLPGNDTRLALRMEIGVSAEDPSTRASYDNSDQIFGANSTFRMLVFSGAFGTGVVDMTKPTYNVVCKVNAGANGASIIEPVTSLELPKGDYKFVCFPADDKFNTWSAGAVLTDAKENEKSVSTKDDFVCLITDLVSLATQSYQLNLGAFARTGYLLTVTLKNESGGALTSPVGNIELTITDNGTINRVINAAAKVDILTKGVSAYSTFSVKDNVKVNGSGSSQSFTAFSKILSANGSASQKLKITYPTLTFAAGTGSITVPTATYVTTGAVAFKAGYKYNISLRVGPMTEQPPAIEYVPVGGVKWARGNLDYSTSKGFFVAPTPNMVSGATGVRQVRGALFRWFAPYPQNEQVSPSSASPTAQIWTLTTPNWNGVTSTTLGNYSIYGRYMPTPDFDPKAMNVTTLGDPCTALPGGNWRLPTYNELYLLCYYSNSRTPSGTFNSNKRPHGKFFVDTGETYAVGSYPTAVSHWTGIYIDGCLEPTERPASTCGGSSASTQYDSSLHLFLPAASYSSGNYVNTGGMECYYWSSTPVSGNGSNSWGLIATASSLVPTGTVATSRTRGFSVRCVYD